MSEIASLIPAFRGKIGANAPLAPYTWFRVGGPAEWLVSPADDDDLAYLLSRLPAEIPVLVIGVGSNLIVRDGGVKGVVIRLGGRAFGGVEALAEHRLEAGAAALDARAAQAAGVNGTPTVQVGGRRGLRRRA